MAAAEEAKRQEAARQAKAEQERKKQQVEQARVAAATAAQREDYLKKMMSQAAATGSTNSTGTAARNSGPSATYAGRIKARIKPNIVFSDSVSGNPTASVEVRVAPDGAIVSRRLVHSSGVRAWDDAVLRAIDKTETLPRDVDGSVPPRLQIEFKPND
jgi:colicin import membrane protein